MRRDQTQSNVMMGFVMDLGKSRHVTRKEVKLNVKLRHVEGRKKYELKTNEILKHFLK